MCDNFSDRLLAAEIGLLKDTCVALGSPRAIAVFMLVSAGEYREVLQLAAPDKDAFVNPDFPDDYLLQEMVRKNPRLPLAVNRRNAAGRSWCAAERQNRQTNSFILSHNWGDDSFLSRAVKRARRRIARVLGPCDEQVLDDIVSRGRHGPGATSTVRGRNVSPATKMITSLGVTPELWPLRHSITPLWQDDTVGFIPELWDTWINVPKNALTDRGICINPGLNVYIQLGVGDVIRDKLRAHGLDIRNGQSRHKWLVGLAERLGLATIDLSSASDSICYQLVRLLLPKRWFHLLEMLRTSHTKIYGKTVHVAKFSAMGNGYTFELETLIFWALTLSVDEMMVEDATSDVRLLRFASCYGDDIIVQQGSAHRLIEVLGLLGFRTNDKKTFLAGTFFESCGADVWNGLDVRPFYLDAEPDDMHEAVILMANAVRIYAHRRAGYKGCDKRFLKPWLNTVSRSKIAKATGMPVTWSQRSATDIERTRSISAASGLIRNFDEFTPKAVASLQHRMATWDGWLGRMYYQRPTPFRSQNDLYPVGLYIASLATVNVPNSLEYLWASRVNSNDSEFFRGSREKGRLKSTICPNWVDVGPWVDLHDRRG